MHEHQHGNAHTHQGNGDNSGLGLAFFLNLGFTLLEIVGGIFTNSIAIISDALHDLGDSLSLGIAWYFERVARRGRSEKYSYGYKRYSVLAAIINSLVLIVGSTFVVMEALKRLQHPEQVHEQGMLILAVIGIAVNGFAVVRLQRGSSLNTRVVRLHLLEDVFGWVAILIGAVVMMLWEIPWIDPGLSIAISAFILFQVVKRLRYSIRIVMQAVPGNIDLDRILSTISAIPEVESVHDPHLWSMDGDYHIFTVHAVVRNSIPKSELGNIRQKIRAALQETDIQHSTIELEFQGEECILVNC